MDARPECVRVSTHRGGGRPASTGSRSRDTRRLLAVLAGWIERARQRRCLADLSDRSLKDIGISRYDALHEARKPFWRG
jgi:uncharacterized protein YjiS (DUF1127 family)